MKIRPDFLPLPFTRLRVCGIGLALAIGVGVMIWQVRLSPSLPTKTFSIPPASVSLHLDGPLRPSSEHPAAAVVEPPSFDAVWDVDWARAAQSQTPGDGGGSRANYEASLGLLHPSDRIALVSVILSEASRNSSVEAVRAAIAFCENDPAYSLEYGRALISSLSERGDFRAALRFVLAEDFDGGKGENGSKWLVTLFSRWGELTPAQAARATQENVPPGWRTEALQTVAAAWVKTDPAALAEFVTQIPSQTDRALVLHNVLTRWADIDPAAAHTWSINHAAVPE